MCQATNCRMRTIIINVYDRMSFLRMRRRGGVFILRLRPRMMVPTFVW